MNWRNIVLEFAERMILRFKQKDDDGWGRFDEVEEEEYQERAIDNIKRRDYIDAANLCLLAEKYCKEEGTMPAVNYFQGKG